jgi:hypothetical protein
MHRSGTSAVARGLKALSVYLGNDFLDAQPENPTGYWEDRGIVELNERILKTVGLTWDAVGPLAAEDFRGLAMWRLRRKAARYVKRSFGSHPLWGFKDPRTIRLLPFWQRALHESGAADSYVVVIRNPLSIAASLYRRQQMDLATAYRLWLAYMVPFFRDLRGKQMVVVDYDLLMLDPRAQLVRSAHALDLPSHDGDIAREIDRFAEEFLDERLRHTIFSFEDFDMGTPEARLTQAAYLMLYELATDRLSPLSESFWSTWHGIESEVQTLLRPS